VTHNAMPCHAHFCCDMHAVLCCAVLCCAVLCCAVLCCAVLCCAVLCCAVLCSAELCCAAVEAAGPSPDEAADIMALVALNLSRDQALQQEVAQQQGGAAGLQVRTHAVFQCQICSDAVTHGWLSACAL
jgi:hypothetical protein